MPRLGLGTEEDGNNSDDSDSNEDKAKVDDLEEEQGKACLMVVHSTPASSVMSILLEALLLGHKDPVTSFSWSWRCCRSNNGNNSNRPCPLRSSMDQTIVLWMEEEGGAWILILRVGGSDRIVAQGVHQCRLLVQQGLHHETWVQRVRSFLDAYCALARWYNTTLLYL